MIVLHFFGRYGDHDYVFISFDLYIHGSWDRILMALMKMINQINGLWNLNLIWNT